MEGDSATIPSQYFSEPLTGPALASPLLQLSEQLVAHEFLMDTHYPLSGLSSVPFRGSEVAGPSEPSCNLHDTDFSWYFCAFFPPCCLFQFPVLEPVYKGEYFPKSYNWPIFLDQLILQG